MKTLHLILCALILMYGCSSSKNLGSGPPPLRSKSELIGALQKRNYDFSWFSGKASTELKSQDENISGSLQIRMKRDSVVWIAVKKFGIEAARVQVDKNQYTILYRLEGLYQRGNISDIGDILSIAPDFEDLQHLVFGNVILPDSQSTEVAVQGALYILTTRMDGIVIDYKINGHNLMLEGADITDRMGRKASIQYKDYRKVSGGHLISFERRLDFPYTEKDQASFYLKFSEIEVDVPVEIKFNIPKSYSEIF